MATKWRRLQIQNGQSTPFDRQNSPFLSVYGILGFLRPQLASLSREISRTSSCPLSAGHPIDHAVNVTQVAVSCPNGREGKEYAVTKLLSLYELPTKQDVVTQMPRGG